MMDMVGELKVWKEDIRNLSKVNNSASDAKDRATARERISLILDENSFMENGIFAKGNSGGVIAGYGTVNGRLTYIFSQDYMNDGGALGKTGAGKISAVMEMALKMGAPVIGIYDSIGAKLEEGIDVLNSYGSILAQNARLSGVVPQISYIAGPCTGAAAISAQMNDFTIMLKKYGEIYVNSPEDIAKWDNKYTDAKDYADGEIASIEGGAQFAVDSDKEAAELIRKIIDYLPGNNAYLPPVSNFAECLSDYKENLDRAVNDGGAGAEEIIKSISDDNSEIEMYENFSRNTITKLIKLNGLTVGVIANGSGKNSRLNNEGIIKLTRMIKLCNCFNIPILSIADSEGFEASLVEEKSGLALNCAKMLAALSMAEVPKVALVTGKAVGSAGILMSGKSASFDMVFSWPDAKICFTHPQTALKELYKDEILSSQNPKLEEEKLLKEAEPSMVSPLTAAKSGYIDDIIIPGETRMILYGTFDMLKSKRIVTYPRKHGSILV